MRLYFVADHISKLMTFESVLIGVNLCLKKSHNTNITDHNPISFHILSILIFTPASIFSASGQSLLNPSSFPFRVASIPILEPRFGRGEAWSSVSVGALSIIVTSVAGSYHVVVAHRTSLISCTFTSSSSTIMVFANIICPIPHRAKMTFFACPG